MYSYLVNAPKPKDVLPLAQEITRLEGQLAEAKRRWNLLFGVAVPEKKPRAASLDGITTKVLEFIEESRGAESTIALVSQRIEEDGLPVGRALYRLARAGKISNPARGRYTAIEKEADSEEKTS